MERAPSILRDHLDWATSTDVAAAYRKGMKLSTMMPGTELRHSEPHR
jgi:hypothetical protein